MHMDDGYWTPWHLAQEELVELRKKNTELEKDIGFLQSCVNSGETATKSDRPSEQAKQLKGQN